MRKIGLDILRAIAIILVLFRHSLLEDNVVQYFGWLGVDLFFVLSGFLVSGLLFSEYKKTGSLNIKKFIIRRGFKIFPPFYFFLIFTLLFDYFIRHQTYEWPLLLSELFYVQSYFPRIWIHTWSLAVEEQFYISLALFAYIFVKIKIPNRKNLVLFTLIFLLILSFCMRFYIAFPRKNTYFGFMQTHLRADGIIVGILLSYLYHFTTFTTTMLRKKWLLLFLCAVFISPGFYWAGGSFWMNTVGLSSVNLGFGMLVLLSLQLENYQQLAIFNWLKWPIKILTFIGINSYSIYLWHLNGKDLVYSNFNFGVNAMTTLYIFCALILGILMSYLIEKNALKLREMPAIKKWYQKKNEPKSMR